MHGGGPASCESHNYFVIRSEPKDLLFAADQQSLKCHYSITPIAQFPIP
jgi:hypothetical protein